MAAHNFVDYFFRRINGVKRVQFDSNLERTSGEGTYLFANGLPIGMATPGDAQGVKMEFDYGVTATVTGAGKTVHGLDIKMTMDKDWDFSSNLYNGTVRGARIQVVSEDDVSGRLTGAYINAIAEGTKTIRGYVSGGAPTGPGIIGIQARTEIQTSATITTPGAAGIMIFSRIKQDATLAGSTFGYRALQIELPMLGTGSSITGTTSAIYVGKDWTAAGYQDVFDYGINIATGTCLRPFYAACTLTGAAAINAMHLVVTDTTITTSGINRGIYVAHTTSGTHASGGEAEGIGVDMAVTGNVSVCSCITLYQAAIANKTIAGYYGIDSYMEDCGTACTRFYSLNLGQVHTNAATESGFIRMRNHGAQPFNAVFKLEASNPATYLITMGPGTPYSGTNPSVQDGSLVINYNGSAKYIALYSS